MDKRIELSNLFARLITTDIVMNSKYPLNEYQVLLDVENEQVSIEKIKEEITGWQPYLFYPVKYIVDWLYWHDREFLFERVCNNDDLSKIRHLAADDVERMRHVCRYWITYIYQKEFLAKIIRQYLYL